VPGGRRVRRFGQCGGAPGPGTRLHRYEIKPLAAESAVAVKAAMYVSLFAEAGVAVALGPTTEPG